MKKLTKKNHIVATIHEAIKWVEKYEDISGYEVEVIENGEEFRVNCVALTEDEKLDLLEAATLIIISLKELHKIALQDSLRSLEKAKELSEGLVKSCKENIAQLEFEETIPSQVRKDLATFAANAKYGKPGGLREKNAEREKIIRAIWASGKYSTRNDCAEKEYINLGYGSFKKAREALTNTAKPSHLGQSKRT